MFYSLIPGTLLALSLVAAAPSKEDTPFHKEFNDRIGEYMKLRKSASEGVPSLKPKSTPEQIQAHRLALLQAIRAARAGAKQGTVFSPLIREHFLKVIRSEMRGKEGTPAKAAVKQGNPAVEGPATVSVQVNAPYPDSAPLSTMPSTLLLRLPALPKQLDFRFVGRHLILRDTEAGMIVDYIPNAVP